MAVRSFQLWSSSSPLLSLTFSQPTRPRSGRLCCSHSPQFSISPVANKTLRSIKSSGVIACLRAKSVELAMDAARAAIDGGISVLEIVISTPGVFEVLQQLVQDYPATTIGVIIFLVPLSLSTLTLSSMHLGFLGTWTRAWKKQFDKFMKAGTVLNSKDAKKAINAGAKFLMSPAIVMDILDYVQGSEAVYIPGAMTPTEILSAYNAGAEIVKVYPVSALGGIHYIAALQKPFSHIPMVASQGIRIDPSGTDADP